MEDAPRLGRTAAAIGLAMMLLLMTAPASVGHPSQSQSQGEQATFTWVDDGTWEMLEPHAPSDSDDTAHAPLFLIPHIDPAHPPHFVDGGGNEWDHVVEAPPGNQGTFNAIWHVFVLDDFEADLDNDGETDCDPAGGVLDECLTSVDKVEEAIDQGDVASIDIDFAFECPVRPHR